jgi:hypothetical protein
MAKKTDNKPDVWYPTPPVGTRVLWREAGGRTVRPADVIEQNGEPGIVALSINLGTQLRRMDAVHWEGHTAAKNVFTPNIQHRGTWAYMPGTEIPEAHYAVHLDLIEQTAKNVVKQQEWIEEQRRLNEEAAKLPVDPIHVAVAREAAMAVLQG